MLTIKQEPFSVVEQNQHLILEHWDEVAVHNYGTMDIDWDSFFLMESIGKLITIVIRHCDEVVGYAVFMVHHHFHAKGTIFADCDAVFVKKSYRKSAAGLELIEKSKKIIHDSVGDCTI